MIPFSGVICDMDGTLIDTERLRKQAIMRLYASRQKLIPEYFLENRHALYCRNTLKWMAENEENPDVKSLGMTAEEREAAVMRDFELLYGKNALPKNGAIDTVKYLHSKGIPMALVTMTELELAVPCLERLGILDCFDPVICTYKAKLTKNDPELFNGIAGKWGVDIRDCLMLDDALYAVRGGKAAGCTVYAVRELCWDKKDTQQVQKTADMFFEDLSGVLEHLKKME